VFGMGEKIPIGKNNIFSKPIIGIASEGSIVLA
jgi:hypothetical protein